MHSILFLVIVLAHADDYYVDGVFHSAFVNNTRLNEYYLIAKLFEEREGTVIGATNSTLHGVDKRSTVMELVTCGTNLFLFQVTTGYLAVDNITFQYVCAYIIATITDVNGILNFTNVDVNQSSNSSYFASSLFDIVGHGLFTNFTAGSLKVSSSSNSLFGGSPVELFLNVCVISNIDFNTSANAAIVYSSSANVQKSYFFNNTIFANFTRTGNAKGGLFLFASSLESTYTFESCTFKNIPMTMNTTGGIVYASTTGTLNFTYGDFGNITGGTNGSIIHSAIVHTYFSRSNFHDLNTYSFGSVWVESGTLAIVSTVFDKLSATYTAGAICMGSAMTILLTNFSNLNSSNPRNANNSNTGVYMGSSTGLLTLSDVIFQNLTGVCNVCIYTACTMSGTNLQFLDSTALANGTGTGTIGITPGSPVAWYTKATSTMTNCLCHNLTANYYSACCKFYGTSTWNSCIFRYIKGTQNGGMCCQDGAIIADNCTFLNLSTSGGDGGAIHWHAYSDTLIRCLMYNCSCTGSGGGMLFGSTYFLANCEFANNTAGQRGNDIHINSSGSPEAVPNQPLPPTPSIDYIYGCCSTSRAPRFTTTSNTNYDDFFPYCTNEIRYVNTSLREGRDTVSCGTRQYPCASGVHTASLFIKDIPLSLNFDYGTYVETGYIEVTNRPVKVEGYDPITETQRTALRADDDGASNLFMITTGTLTCTHIYFLQARWTRSVINVVGNGSMTIRGCVFEQTNTHLVQVLLSSVVLINNSNALCNFEQCLFHDLELEDTSVVWIEAAKRISFHQCQFTDISSSTQVGGNGTTIVSQAGGAISSFTPQFVMTDSSFVQCVTSRNGGAVYFGPQAGFSLTNVTFDRCTAVNGSGGALYLGLSKSDPELRYLARCLFLDNIAANADGNDIRDETGNVESWTGGNVIDCCSISVFRKLSVGNNAISLEKYLDQCFNNPCLNHSAWDCPLECDNSSGVDCIPGNCTRLHLESVCPATCRMHNENCIPDRCYKQYNDTNNCELDSECVWNYPDSYTDSSGDVIIPPGTKVCEAKSECTREPGETNCTTDPCVLAGTGGCVPDKCRVTVLTKEDCPQDCDAMSLSNNSVVCQANQCTRQGRQQDCRTNDGCVLDGTGGCVPDKCRATVSTKEDCPQDCDAISLSNNSVICQANQCTRQGRQQDCRTNDGCVLEETGRCTVDPCYGLVYCTPECTWTDGRCQAHECTRLHNETFCAWKCSDDGEDHCIPTNGSGGGDNNNTERAFDNGKGKKKMSKGAVAGIVIGAVVVLALIGVAILALFIWKRKKTEQDEYKPLD